MQRFRELYSARPLASVLVLWLITRVLSVMVGLGILPYPGGEHVFADLGVYADWLSVLETGQFPAGDPMWQYPPLAGPAFLLGGWAASAFGLPSAYWGMLLLVWAFDAGILALLVTDAKRRGRWLGALLWATAALLIGPVMLGRFDVVPTLAAVAALMLLARPAALGAAIAAGTLLKAWPILGLAAVPRRDLPRAIGWTMVFGALGMVLVAAVMDKPLSFLQEQSERGIQVESVAALPYVLAKAFGTDIEFVYRYGAMEVEAAGTGMAALIITIVGVILLGTLAVLRLAGRLESIPGPDVVFTVLLVAVATSRVNSPQYLVWLFGIGAVCLADRASRMHLPVLLIALSAPVTQLVYPWNYGGMLDGGVIPVLLQVIRIALLLAATGYALYALVKPSAPVPTAAQVLARVSRGGASGDSTRVRVAALEQG